MARVNTVGLTELASALAKREGATRETALRMLEYAGEAAAKVTQICAAEYGLHDTGKMIESIKPGNLTIHSDSASVEVWPQGTRSNGRRRERNAVVGFVQHYGRSYGKTQLAGTGFFDEAMDRAGDEITAGMADIWRESEGDL